MSIPQSRWFITSSDPIAAVGDKYDMLYCDQNLCRVNTFERGEDSRCPGCNRTGYVVQP